MDGSPGWVQVARLGVAGLRDGPGHQRRRRGSLKPFVAHLRGSFGGVDAGAGADGHGERRRGAHAVLFRRSGWA